MTQHHKKIPLTLIKWILEKELLSFVDQKLYLLTFACLTFVKESFELQNLLSRRVKQTNLLTQSCA